MEEALRGWTIVRAGESDGGVEGAGRCGCEVGAGGAEEVDCRAARLRYMPDAPPCRVCVAAEPPPDPLDAPPAEPEEPLWKRMLRAVALQAAMAVLAAALMHVYLPHEPPDSPPAFNELTPERQVKT